VYGFIGYIKCFVNVKHNSYCTYIFLNRKEEFIRLSNSMLTGKTD